MERPRRGSTQMPAALSGRREVEGGRRGGSGSSGINSPDGGQSGRRRGPSFHSRPGGQSPFSSLCAWECFP